MNRVGILSNAKSRRNQTAMPAIEALLKGEPQIHHRTFRDIEALPQCLQELAQAGVEHLIINGGDGTVQATIGELFRRAPFQEMPRISLVGGGMTNVIAHDVGSPAAPVEAIRRILDGIRTDAPGEILSRHAMTLKHGDHERVEYGFLSGAVGFYQGTLLSRRDMHRVGFRQSVAAKAGIIWSVVRLLLHGEGQRSGLQGERVAIGLDGQPPQESPYFLILATTLERLLPGVMPFWGHERGAIKLTTVASPPKRFGLAAMPMARGRPRPWMHRSGYASTRADHIALRLSSPVVLDGEIFEPGLQGQVDLATGPLISFHRVLAMSIARAELTRLVAQELSQPVAPAILAVAEAVRARHGKAAVAVLFYGSCLRKPETMLADALLDFYLLVDDYRAAYDGGLMAFANRVLPPNVFYLEVPRAGDALRCKYAVLTLEHFVAGTSRDALNVSLWARFSQPARLLWSRDPAVADRVAESCVEAILTMLGNAAPLAAQSADAETLWRRAFEATYAAELRSETSDRAAELVRLDLARYRSVTGPALELLREGGGGVSTEASAKLWRKRRRVGKLLNLARLVKATFTFQGALDYVLWKVRRHSGVELQVTDWQRRHPLLSAPVLAWKLYRRGAFR